MLLNTEQSLGPHCVALKPGVLEAYNMQELSRWHAYGVHALTIYVFIPLRAPQTTPHYVQWWTHLSRLG